MGEEGRARASRGGVEQVESEQAEETITRERKWRTGQAGGGPGKQMAGEWREWEKDGGDARPLTRPHTRRRGPDRG